MNKNTTEEESEAEFKMVAKALTQRSQNVRSEQIEIEDFSRKCLQREIAAYAVEAVKK